MFTCMTDTNTFIMCIPCMLLIFIPTVRRQDRDVNYFHMPPASMPEFSPVTTPRLVVGKLICTISVIIVLYSKWVTAQN